jgi:hypothetical protein
MKVFSKRNAIIGWVVYSIAKRRARKAVPGKKGGAIAGGALAGLGGLLGALMFWRKRRSGDAD